MRLLIISHTEHYLKGGQILGWGPTVREIDHLAALFEEVVHLAPLHSAPPPGGAVPYKARNVRLRAVKPAGGETLGGKLSIGREIAGYVSAIRDELARADVAHVRCPAAISLIALLMLTVSRQPRKRWIKYAGNWSPSENDPPAYRLQRWWLKRNLARALVTVNGEWHNQQAHIHSFLNPCLEDWEVEEGQQCAEQKRICEPIRLIFVGNMTTAKGVERAVRIQAKLRQRGVQATLDLIGDGVDRPGAQRLAGELKVESDCRFHGALPRERLGVLYQQAHITLLPSSSEGWPKVLSEGMAYGVVPLSSTVSSIPQYLKRFQTGRALDHSNLESYIETVVWYYNNPDEWKKESLRAADAARLFTYSAYVHAVRTLLGMPL